MFTVHTTCLNFTKDAFRSNGLLVCYVWFSQLTAFVSLNIKQWVFIPDMQCVFCETGIKYYLDEFQASGG
jgi:hypothetical protein